MIGQHLLRLAYRKPPKESIFYGEAGKILSYEEGNVLDLGGGPGYLSRYIRECYYVVQDIDYKLLSYGSEAIDRVLAPAEERVFREACFDTVIMHDALHHFSDVDRALENAHTVSRGRIYIFEFDPGSIIGRFIWLFEKLLGFPGNFYRPEELKKKVGRLCPETDFRRLDRFRYLVKCTHSQS